MNLVDQLNISGNTNLKIPTEICQLRSMFEFEYKEIDDEEIVPQLNQFKHVKEKVEFLNPLYGIKCVNNSVYFLHNVYQIFSETIALPRLSNSWFLAPKVTEDQRF